MNTIHIKKSESCSLAGIAMNNGIVVVRRNLPYRTFLKQIDGKEFEANKAFEVIYVVKGMIGLRVNGSYLNLNEGDVYILEPNRAHCFYANSRDNLLLVAQIDSSFAEEHFNLSPKVSIDSTLKDQRNKVRLIESIRHLYGQKDAGEVTFEESYHAVKEVVDSIKLFVMNQKRSIISTDSIESIVIDITEKYADAKNEKITLEGLADEYNVSGAYLSRMFKKITGVNVSEYFRVNRINYAVDCLINTDLTMTEISNHCGFLDIKALGRDFQKVFGLSPTQFRKQYTTEHIASLEYPYAADSKVRYFLEVGTKGPSQLENEPIKALEARINPNFIKGHFRNAWGVVVDLDCVVDRDFLSIAELRETLGQFKFKTVKIKLAFLDGVFKLQTKSGALRDFSSFEIYNIFTVFSEFDIIPVLRLDFVSFNALLQESASLNEINHAVVGMQKALDEASLIISNSKLREWGYELYFPTINDAVSDQSRRPMFKECIHSFVKVLQEKFDQEKVRWGLYLGSFENDTRDIHQEYLEMIAEMNIEPAFYTCDLNFTNNDFGSDQLLPKILNDIREINHAIRISLPADRLGRHIVAASFNYTVEDDYRWNDAFDNPFYNLLFLPILLQLSLGDFYFSSWNILGKSQHQLMPMSYSSFYNYLGVERMPFYVLKFLQELFSTVVDYGEGYIVTRNHHDYAIIVYSNYYESYRRVDSKDRNSGSEYERKVNFKIESISGRYKMTERYLDYKNAYFCQNWIEDTGMSNLTPEERDYIRQQSNPRMKVKYLEIDGELDYAFNQSLLNISLIKLNKI